MSSLIQRPNSGGALIIAVVLIAVIGLFYAVLSRTYLSKQMYAIAIKRSGELHDIRNYLRTGVFCPFTLAMMGPNCPSGYINLEANQAIPLFHIVGNDPANYTKIGEYELRASCTGGPSPVNIKVEYKRTKDLAWDDLFKGMPLLCEWPEGVRERLLTLP